MSTRTMATCHTSNYEHVACFAVGDVCDYRPTGSNGAYVVKDIDGVPAILSGNEFNKHFTKDQQP